MVSTVEWVEGGGAGGWFHYLVFIDAGKQQVLLFTVCRSVSLSVGKSTSLLVFQFVRL